MRFIREHAAVKSIAGIILLLLVLTLIVSRIAYNSFSDAILRQYAEGAFLTAEAAKQSVDADRMEEYENSGGTSEEYREVWDALDRICNFTGATFVYVIEPDRSDYGHITFLFSTINHDSDYNVFDFGYVRETTNDDYREKYRRLYDKESERELVIRDKGYIETDPHITAMTSLVGSDGEVKAILCVQRQMDVLVQARYNALSRVAFVFILLGLLVIVLMSLFLHYTLLGPLKQITDEAKRFSEENTPADKKLRDNIHNVDEIGTLAESIDQMEEQIQKYVENLTQITAEKERINTELALATKIQADMLPNIFPAFPDRPGFDIYASMTPAKAVGGDFYDFFLVDDDHLCITIADVSGKGVPAALFMMASKTILANNALTGRSPAEILTEANRVICGNNREEMFVTVWLGILELSTGRLTAANAGHEYPVLRRESGKYELLKDPHGFVIGGMEGMKYKEYVLTLEPGSKLFLYTDGVPEAADANYELYGLERMLDALNEEAAASPEAVLKNVRRSVDEFVGEAEQFDDLTMVCLEYRKQM